MMDFSQRYNRENFVAFLQNDFLPEDDFQIEISEAEIQQNTQYIKAITRLGACPSLGLAVYEARHTSTNDARVTLSKEIFRFMANKRERKALVLFVPQDKDANYRFSLISIDLDETEDGKIKRTYSNPRRYSYYLGEGIAARTPKDYLIKKKRVQDAADLVERFSVEILNNEFFKEYKAQYQKFCDFLVEDSEMRQSFAHFLNQEKAIRDYVKKMLGRIVFLYFVQRKGWLNDDYRYMSRMFSQATDDVKSDFLDRVLEPMFFGLLNTLEEKRQAKAEKNGWDLSLIPGWEKIPYLNGGLFEQDEIDKCKSVFPKEYFAELFDFFDTYNFTIDENDPDDNEVGIDPEMLGHIFENLLEDNKDKGAFYTPKEIVQYMCRESVIQYLKTHNPDMQPEVIEHLIRDGEVDKELQEKPKAQQLTKLLSEVKVCDPAIGSGAFPMGVLNVLYHARRLLYGFTGDNQAFSPTDVKCKIIQNNIYGVDIEQGAVDIARLRFWLSLVVDAPQKQLLPNLDYKIMQGNSLLESFMGYDLSQILSVNKDGKVSKRATTSSTNDIQRKIVFKEELTFIDEIQRLIRVYFSPDPKNHLRKDELKREIADRVKEYIIICGANNSKVVTAVNEIKEENKPFFLWHLYFADVFQKGGFDIVIGNPPYIKEGRMSKTYFAPYKESRYYKGKMDIWYMFACNGLDLLNKNGVLCFIATNNWVTSYGASVLRNKVMQETRICNLIDFGAVMIFDSASIQTMIMLFQKDSKSDDYTFDYRRLTKDKATEKDAIRILAKGVGNKEVEYKNAECFKPTIRRGNYIDKTFTFSNQENIFDNIRNGRNIIYLNDKELTNGIHPHYDFINKRLSEKFNLPLGIGIFGLTSEEYESLGLSEREKALIKPYYNSADNVHRYNITPSSTKLIYTNSSFKDIHSMDKYPHLKKHLDNFTEVISSDNKPYGLHRAREERFFLGEKVVALRKCADRPIFAYTNMDTYLSATFYVIKTSRVNMKYLTGLFNSRLIEFWLKNKGKMQGTNYQLDKEPLMEIPIAVPSVAIQQLIASLVDIIIALKNNPTKRASNLVSNEYLVSEYEKLIDGCVYELYFKNEMQSVGVSVIERLMPYINTHRSDDNNLSSIWDIYEQCDKSGLIESIDSLSLLGSKVLRTVILS